MSDYPKAVWRLVITSAKNGAWNMALDEALLEVVRQEHSPPILRLYAWQPPCLSLGYAQHVSEVNLMMLEQNGWDLVRRPTGGRAILHTDELTYAVIGTNQDPRLAGGVLESYRNISLALLHFLKLLDIPAVALPKSSKNMTQTDKRKSGSNQNPVCFEVPSNYEITVNGKKLIGSAQARRKNGVLQHGSIPLYGDLTRIIQTLNFPDQRAQIAATQRLLNHATTIEEVLGYTISWEQASQAFISAFEKVLNLEFDLSKINAIELDNARFLLKEKYSNPKWLHRI